MTTEAELIYTIWDIVTGGKSNADDPINERLMRQFLSIHRGKQLNQYFKKGATVPDEVFQDLGLITFSQSGSEWVSPVLPKMIRLQHRQGIALDKDGFVISVLNSEEYTNAKNNKYNKLHPRTKFVNNVLTLNVGEEQLCSVLEDHSNSHLNLTVRKLKAEALQASLNINARAILVNPDDGVGYDIDTSLYPMSDELIENMVNSVNAREFNIFIKMKADETGDIRSNTADYNTREEI